MASASASASASRAGAGAAGTSDELFHSQTLLHPVHKALLSNSPLVASLTTALHDNPSAAPDLLRSLLRKGVSEKENDGRASSSATISTQASQTTSLDPTALLRLKYTAVNAVVTILHRTELSGKHATACVQVLLDEMESLPEKVLVATADDILNGLIQPRNSGKAFELLPKLCALLAPRAVLDVGALNLDRMSGAEFCSYLVDRLCKGKWAEPAVLPVMCALHELAVDEERLERVVKKLVRQLPSLNVQQLPAFVYHLLLVARKGFRELVLAALLRHIDRLDDGVEKDAQIVSAKQLALVEGAVLLHFDFAIKQDPRLNALLLKLVRSRTCSLSPFAFALLLTAARIPRLERGVFSLLRSNVLGFFVSTHRRRRSAFAEYVLHRIPALFTDAARSLMHAVESSACGWDQILPSLLTFAGMLLDSRCTLAVASPFAPPSARALSAGDALPPRDRLLDSMSALGLSLSTRDSVVQTLSPEGNCVRLGAWIMKELFRLPTVRKEVVDQALNRILVSASEGSKGAAGGSEGGSASSHGIGAGGASGGALAMVALLGDLVAERAHTLLEFLPKVKDTLDYLSVMLPDVALHYLRALLPLMAIRHDLKDYAILVLRKSLYRREADNMDVALEMLGFLRRGFTQQLVVRERLYNGLAHLCETRPALRPFIADVLFSQFSRVFEPDESVAMPLNLESCYDKESAAACEPLPVLLQTVQRCLLVSGASAARDDAVEMLRERFSSALNRLCRCSFEQLGVRMPSSDGPEAPDAAAGDCAAVLARGTLLLGSIQSCIEYVVLQVTGKQLGRDEVERVHRLFSLHQRLASDLMGERAKDVVKARPKKKPKRAAGAEARAADENGDDAAESAAVAPAPKAKPRARVKNLPAVVWRSETVGLMLREWMQCPGSPLSAELWSSRPLMLFVLQVASESLSHARHRARVTAAASGRPQVEPFVTDVGACLAKLVSLAATSAAAECKQAREVALPALAALLQTAELVAACGDEATRAFVKQALPGDDGVDDAATISSKLEGLQRIFAALLQERMVREAELVVQVLQALTPCVGDTSSSDAGPIDAHRRWILSACRETPIGDHALARAMVSLFASLNTAGREVTTLAAVVEDMKALMGEHRNVAREAQRTEMQVVNENTKVALAAFLMTRFGALVDEVEWLQSQLKLFAPMQLVEDDTLETLGGLPMSDLAKMRASGRNAVFSRMFGLARVIATMTETCYEGTAAQSLLRLLATFYRLAGSMCRSLLVEKCRPPPQKFEDLVQCVCELLTPGVYSFITFAQSQDADQSLQHIKRERTVIPSLIFAIEQLEHMLIKYSKQSGADLTRWLRRSTARDFRIDVEAVQRAQEQSNADKGKGGGKGKGKSKGKGEDPGKGKGKESASEKVGTGHGSSPATQSETATSLSTPTLRNPTSRKRRADGTGRDRTKRAKKKPRRRAANDGGEAKGEGDAAQDEEEDEEEDEDEEDEEREEEEEAVVVVEDEEDEEEEQEQEEAKEEEEDAGDAERAEEEEEQDGGDEDEGDDDE